MGFDTEDADGKTTLTALTSRLGDKYWKYTPGTQDELLRELALLGQNYRVAVWTLNLPYDLVNFLGEDLPSVCRLYLARKKIVGADLKGHPSVSFFEIGRFCPKMSLAAIGKAIGLPKLELAFDDPRRVVRDAKIAERAGERIIRELDKLKIPLRFSPVSGAYAAFEAENDGRLPMAARWVREIGRKALYGGRTEVMYRGQLKSKPGSQLHYFDFNQQYGRAMLEALPDYTVVEESKEPTERLFIADVTVRVRATNGMAPLPYHHDEAGLIFPVGEFRGTWTSEDLRLTGVEVLRYHKVYNFPYSGPYLKAMIKKLIPKESDHVLTKAIKKNLYTGLSGKWSQNNTWTYFTHWEKAKPEDYWNGVNLGDYILAQRDGVYPRWSNFVWSAFIQSKARRWLWELYELIWAEKGEVLYTDTDSALALLSAPIRAARILDRMSGRLKHKTIGWANVFGPKAFLLGSGKGARRKIEMLSAKGIPGKLHENILRGEEEFESETPESFFSLLRSTAITEEEGFKNRWTRKHFKLAKRFYNRRPNPRDLNRTLPLRLVDGDVKM